MTLNVARYESYQRYNLGSEYTGCLKVDQRIESYGFPLTYLTHEWVPHTIHDGDCPLHLDFSVTALLSNNALGILAFAIGFVFFRWFQFGNEMNELDVLLNREVSSVGEMGRKDIVHESRNRESEKLFP